MLVADLQSATNT